MYMETIWHGIVSETKHHLRTTVEHCHVVLVVRIIQIIVVVVLIIHIN